MTYRPQHHKNESGGTNGLSPKTRNSDDRRDAILAAAHRLFAKRGFEGTRLEDVARAACVSKGTLYAVATDKLDLFLQVSRRLIIEDIEETNALLAEIDDPRQAVVALYENTMPPENDERGHYAIMFEVLGLAIKGGEIGARVSKLHRELHNKPLEFIMDLLRGGINAGVFRADIDVEIVARQMNAWIDRNWAERLLAPDAPCDQFRNLNQRYVDSLLDWIAPEKKG